MAIADAELLIAGDGQFLGVGAFEAVPKNSEPGLAIHVDHELDQSLNIKTDNERIAEIDAARNPEKIGAASPSAY